jgi:threonine dehydrogenase-like Zn-dependent dehydrogenase
MARALWYVGADKAELREEEVAAPKPGEVQVHAMFGGISRGTERLVHQGRVPASEYERMRAPFMGGSFPFPVKYGYATVGRIVSGPRELQQRFVFTLHPHQDVFNLPAAAAFPIPEAVPASRAVLAANMETALNGLWDGTPGPADRIAIVGGGTVGLLLAYLCARLPGAEVTLVDVVASRAMLADAVGARFANPPDAPQNCDLVFHASGTGAGLATALQLAGEEAAIVEMSWYGQGDVAAPFGEAFHSRRLRLLSSQVGRVAPSHRLRWTPARRIAAAISLLADPVLDKLLAPPLGFKDLPDKLAIVFAPEGNGLCPIVRYPAAANPADPA